MPCSPPRVPSMRRSPRCGKALRLIATRGRSPQTETTVSVASRVVLAIRPPASVRHPAPHSRAISFPDQPRRRSPPGIADTFPFVLPPSAGALGCSCNLGRAAAPYRTQAAASRPPTALPRQNRCTLRTAPRAFLRGPAPPPCRAAAKAPALLLPTAAQATPNAPR